MSAGKAVTRVVLAALIFGLLSTQGIPAAQARPQIGKKVASCFYFYRCEITLVNR